MATDESTGDRHGVFIVETVVDKQAAFAIRQEVFVDEQGVPAADEYDRYDERAGTTHLLAVDEGQPVGTMRVREINGEVGRGGKIERVAVRQAARERGWGAALMDRAESLATDRDYDFLLLHSQVHAEAFYAKLGYETESDVFVEDGIDHVRMRKRLDGLSSR